MKQTKTEKLMEEQKTELQEALKDQESKQRNGVGGMVTAMFLPSKHSKDEEGWTVGCGDCFRFTCCPREVNSRERIMELKLILAELQKMQTNVTDGVDARIIEIKYEMEKIRQDLKLEEQNQHCVDHVITTENEKLAKCCEWVDEHSAISGECMNITLFLSNYLCIENANIKLHRGLNKQFSAFGNISGTP